MLILVTLWWLFFFTTAALCLGSFLNVVIYRLPAGLAINRPVWSFCPRCDNRIAWYDNLPVIGYLRLRGRCRNCWAPISARYPQIELMTAMLVIVLLDTFFVGQARDGLQTIADLNVRIADDWPIFLAHVIVFACLLAMSAIDIQYYWVDIRFTHFAALCGFVLHMIWTPSHSRSWGRPFDATIVVTGAMFIVFAAVWLVLHRRREDIPESEQEVAADEPSPPSEPASVVAVGIPLAVLAFAMFTVCASALMAGWALPFGIRAGVPLAFLGMVIVRESSRVRESDAEIADIIESEAPAARSGALREFAVLLPALVVGALVWWYLHQGAGGAASLRNVIHWAPFDGAWQPLWGLGTAVAGYTIAAGIGWTIRLVFNVAFAKEAYATGDIHMMAAAGAVIGWQAVLLGFIVACGLALIGWLAVLPFKRAAAIPLGPWLTLGFLVATVFYKPLVATRVVRNLVDVVGLLFFGDSQFVPIRILP